jgi:hypothetical protein
MREHAGREGARTRGRGQRVHEKECTHCTRGSMCKRNQRGCMRGGRVRGSQKEQEQEGSSVPETQTEARDRTAETQRLRDERA